MTIRTLCLAAIVCVPLVGCATPRHQSRPLPDPILETRSAPPSQWVRPAPTPKRPQQAETPKPKLTPVAQSLRGMTIVVDPGHGGRDPGARGLCKLPEKTVNLSVANKLVALLKQRGATVRVTRSDDRFITLEDRSKFAEKHRADLFVSIHSDAAKRQGARGATVYIARGASQHSKHAGQAIATALSRAGLKSLGVRSAGFRVLVDHSRPAVLVECGYMTNPTEARQLATTSHQQKLAEAICEGITTTLSARAAR